MEIEASGGQWKDRDPGPNRGGDNIRVEIKTQERGSVEKNGKESFGTQPNEKVGPETTCLHRQGGKGEVVGRFFVRTEGRKDGKVRGGRRVHDKKRERRIRNWTRQKEFEQQRPSCHLYRKRVRNQEWRTARQGIGSCLVPERR